VFVFFCSFVIFIFPIPSLRVAFFPALCLFVDLFLLPPPLSFFFFTAHFASLTLYRHSSIHTNIHTHTIAHITHNPPSPFPFASTIKQKKAMNTVGRRKFMICGVPVTYELALRVVLLVITVGALIAASIPKVKSILGQANVVSVTMTDSNNIPAPGILVCGELMDSVSIEMVSRGELYPNGTVGQDVARPIPSSKFSERERPGKLFAGPETKKRVHSETRSRPHEKKKKKL
ncbi:hypothetical protein EDD21DRAFT_85566, partial [Dissophora ornata]